jgi:hypothetical protein
VIDVQHMNGSPSFCAACAIHGGLFAPIQVALDRLVAQPQHLQAKQILALGCARPGVCEMTGVQIGRRTGFAGSRNKKPLYGS